MRASLKDSDARAGQAVKQVYGLWKVLRVSSSGHHLGVCQRARNEIRWSIELAAEDKQRHFMWPLDARNMFETYNGYL